MVVSICISTYKRPASLKRLLEALGQLTFVRIEEPEVEVIVVDNDATGSAHALWEQFNGFRWPLKYSIEPRHGISYARNSSVKNASVAADFIAMIDDDEAPVSSWLERLLVVQRQYNADVVTGPVLPDFMGAQVPTWVNKGRFFHCPRYQTGHQVGVAFTNNVLCRATALRSSETIFDERFALTGGEDAHLFMRLCQQGKKLVWCDEAIVYEFIPRSRISLWWILRRGFHAWSIHSFIERELYPSTKLRLVRMFKGGGLIGVGALAVIPAFFVGKHAIVRALLSMFRGGGTLAGSLRLRFQEYKRFRS